MRRMLLAVIILLLTLSLFTPAVAKDKPAPAPKDPKERWLMRALEAMYRSQDSTEEDILVLSLALAEEKYRTCWMVVVECLRHCDPVLVYIILEDEQIERLIAAVGDKNWMYNEAILVLLKRATGVNKGKRQQRWQDWWEKNRLDYHKKKAKFIRKAIRAGKYKPPKVVSGGGDDGLDLRSVVPQQLRELVGQLMHGLDLVICIDDTGSMTGWMNEVKNASYILFLVMNEITPGLRAGFISYKDDVNHRMGFTDDHRKARKFIEDLRPGGGGDHREGMVYAMKYGAYNPKYDWRKPAYKSMLIVGDAMPHGVVQWINAAKKTHKETGIHINTLCVKRRFVEGWQEVALGCGGVAYNLQSPGNFVEQFAYATSGAHGWDQFSTLIHFLIPRLLVEAKVNK
ncbi:hypothetical protein ACFL54_04795 [Planctomycetota bacterium]